MLYAEDAAMQGLSSTLLKATDAVIVAICLSLFIEIEAENELSVGRLKLCACYLFVIYELLWVVHATEAFHSFTH